MVTTLGNKDGKLGVMLPARELATVQEQSYRVLANEHLADFKVQADADMYEGFGAFLSGDLKASTTNKFVDIPYVGDRGILKHMREATKDVQVLDNVQAVCVPWQKHHLLHIPGAHKFLTGEYRRRKQFDIYIGTLYAMGPQSMDQAWHCYKYIVKQQRPTDREIEVVMTRPDRQDWDRVQPNGRGGNQLPHPVLDDEDDGDTPPKPPPRAGCGDAPGQAIDDDGYLTDGDELVRTPEPTSRWPGPSRTPTPAPSSKTTPPPAPPRSYPPGPHPPAPATVPPVLAPAPPPLMFGAAGVRPSFFAAPPNAKAASIAPFPESDSDDDDGVAVAGSARMEPVLTGDDALADTLRAVLKRFEGGGLSIEEDTAMDDEDTLGKSYEQDIQERMEAEQMNQAANQRAYESNLQQQYNAAQASLAAVAQEQAQRKAQLNAKANEISQAQLNAALEIQARQQAALGASAQGDRRLSKWHGTQRAAYQRKFQKEAQYQAGYDADVLAAELALEQARRNRATPNVNEEEMEYESGEDGEESGEEPEDYMTDDEDEAAVEAAADEVAAAELRLQAVEAAAEVASAEKRLKAARTVAAIATNMKQGKSFNRTAGRVTRLAERDDRRIARTPKSANIEYTKTQAMGKTAKLLETRRTGSGSRTMPTSTRIELVDVEASRARARAMSPPLS
ncbi:hypothetical protein T492DRAFT_835427 [Pavlovales sp. CCMP2436]|nr:hypothetical protein T492DRAFT_835427 [Pavlovales sp. CCMP2436]